MRPWSFAKPKTPGFGISGSFYLTVLSSRPVLPPMLRLIEPTGSMGAVAGFGAPLSPSKDKSSLGEPLERGAYALATKDRKTVLKMLVMSRDEARFDPDTYATSSYALGCSPELLARLRGTWTVIQLTFESHDPSVYPSLDFLLAVAARLAELTEGVVADATSQRYLLPEQVMFSPRMDPRVDARDMVSISLKARPDGVHAFTLGMQKFDLPELEMIGIEDDDATLASRFLITLAQSALLGDLIHSGDRFGAPGALLEAREGGFDNSLWEGISVLELLPPTRLTTSEALAAWNLRVKEIHPEEGKS